MLQVSAGSHAECPSAFSESFSPHRLTAPSEIVLLKCYESNRPEAQAHTLRMIYLDNDKKLLGPGLNNLSFKRILIGKRAFEESFQKDKHYKVTVRSEVLSAN